MEPDSPHTGGNHSHHRHHKHKKQRPPARPSRRADGGNERRPSSGGSKTPSSPTSSSRKTDWRQMRDPLPYHPLALQHIESLNRGGFYGHLKRNQHEALEVRIFFFTKQEMDEGRWGGASVNDKIYTFTRSHWVSGYVCGSHLLVVQGNAKEGADGSHNHAPQAR